DRPVTQFFLFAVRLWEPVRRRAAMLEEQGMGPVEAMRVAADEICSRQQAYVALPRRFSTPMREVWQLQPRFENRTGKRALRLLGHPRFRAAYDFLILRAQTGEADPDLAAHWMRLQESDAATQQAMLSQPEKRGGSRRRNRRRRTGKDSDGGAG